MTNNTEQQAVPVAQSDRDAAATLEAILRDVWDGYSSVHAIREGCADGSSIVQAFAHHRLAAINATQTREAELVGFLEQVLLYADPSGDGLYDGAGDIAGVKQNGALVLKGSFITICTRIRAALNAQEASA